MSNLSDVVGGANLYGGSNYSFIFDRFCSPNSAIYFYFSRIFEFGNGINSDNVLLAMLGESSQIYGNTIIGSSYMKIQTSLIINLNEWFFISFILTDTTGFIYVNGNQMINGTLDLTNNIIRTSNYIGKSNWASSLNADAIYDELKIYQGALSSSDIMNEYQISSNNGKS